MFFSYRQIEGLLLYNMTHMKEKNSTIGDGHPNSKFANELGALHKYENKFLTYIKNTFKNVSNDR